jgi:hypothetical protein
MTKLKQSQAELFQAKDYAATGPTEDVVFIRTDNAIAMYLRGRLLTDGVSISKETALTALGIEHSTFDADDLWWSEQAGCLFPKNLSEVKTVKE